MEWYSIDTWIVVIAALAAGACALLGNFLVLRKMSMMGDAISHAVLPGLAIAFLVTGARASLSMFIGAAIAGVLTAVFTQWISRFGKVDEGASMGIVFTTLFALGLLIELTPLDVVWRPTLFGLSIEVPRTALVLAGVTLFNAVFVVAFFKELRISSFDAELATTMGIDSKLMHYLLMTLVAVTTVACFESVGSIIVIAMLIVPAATAHLLTDRLWLMVVLSVLIAIGSAILGHMSALIVPAWFGFADTSTSGMMAVMAGLIFSTVMLFAPKYGVLQRFAKRAQAVK
jgi:manganese/zinc/iron transport system permease protein